MLNLSGHLVSNIQAPCEIIPKIAFHINILYTIKSTGHA